MNHSKKYLSITFSKFCMDCAKANNVDLDEMVNCLTNGEVFKMNDGHLSFRYMNIEVITCEQALIAMSVIRHKDNIHSLLYKNIEQMSPYEYAMVA